MIQAVLDTFKAIVIDEQVAVPMVDVSLADCGVVLDAVPTAEQVAVIRERYQPLNMVSLFGREERETEDFMYLIQKQMLNYIETYGFGQPGMFEMPLHEERVMRVTKIRGITRDELVEMVQKLVYANAPLKDANVIKEIIEGYDIEIDNELIHNNEIRIALFDEVNGRFDNGDDAVRFIIYKTTGNALLIKSKEVIAQVEKNAYKVSDEFLMNHMNELAQVFNRHKRIMLALKKGPTEAPVAEEKASRNYSDAWTQPTLGDILNQAMAARN